MDAARLLHRAKLFAARGNDRLFMARETPGIGEMQQKRLRKLIGVQVRQILFSITTAPAVRVSAINAERAAAGMVAPVGFWNDGVTRTTFAPASSALLRA
jgi:hypothetical protein